MCWWSDDHHGGSVYVWNEACFGANDDCTADSRLAPSQWETSLQSNVVSHWLGANLESALWLYSFRQTQGNQCNQHPLSKLMVTIHWPQGQNIVWYIHPGVNTVRCRYNAVNFLPNPHKIHLIARPLGRDKERNLWFDTLIYILSQSTQCCMKYPVILDRVRSALYCI